MQKQIRFTPHKSMIIGLILAALTIAGPLFALGNDLPTQFDIVMLAGADYLLSLKNTDSAGVAINISGYQYAAQFRSAPAPSGILFATYSATIVDATAGQIKITLSKSQTQKLSGRAGIWDLLQIDALGKYTYLLTGKSSVRPTSTRLP